MDIRLANLGDIPVIVDLLRQVGQVHHLIRSDIFPDGCQKYDETELAALLEDAMRPVFVAAAEGTVLGYCFCKLRQFEESPVAVCRKELYIDDLCVDEAHRGKGVATALYRYVMDYATANGFDSVTLNVWCGNDNAMAFYEKMGMRPRNITMEAKILKCDQ